MKTLIAVSLLLVLVAPAHASKFRESDRKWLSTADEWASAYPPCFNGPGDDEDKAHRDAYCKILNAAQKKLIAHGYCVYANGGVGRPSRDRKHCYTIAWPHDLTP